MSIYISKQPYIFSGKNNEASPFIILGIPLDSTVTYRPGTRFSPIMIRLTSLNIEYFSIRCNFDFDEISSIDMGDVVLPQGDVNKCINIIKDCILYLD